MQKEMSLKVRPYWIYFTLAIIPVAAVYTLYNINIVRWIDSPDYGWRAMFDSGPNVVAEVFESGAKGGLRVGDTIKAINGKSYNTFDELFLKDIRQTGQGTLNTYTIVRDGKTIEIGIITKTIGFYPVLRRSGPLFVIGFIYVIIGILVFLMKPSARESWLFFVMTSLIGTKISISSPSELLTPLWFYDVRIFIDVFIAPSMIHLAFSFPKKRPIVLKRPWLLIIPYVLSFILFALMKAASTAQWNIPPILNLLNLIYLMLGILIFIFSVVWNLIRDTSIIIRLQSQVIFVGLILGFFIPIIDLAFRFLWKVYLFPDPIIGFAAFLSLFPLSIGYTIVKHDLFAIDTIVRRTYGYILSSATIVGAYAIIVSILNIIFQSSEIAGSPVFSILFALGVVFLFEPLRKRFQGIIDRVFYRQQYDYRKTMKYISDAMTSLLDHDTIIKTLMGSVVREMFLENGALLLRNGGEESYNIHAVEGATPEKFSSKRIEKDDVFIRTLKDKNDVISRYDVDLDPHYEKNRESLKKIFQTFSSEVMVPMKYKDEIRGIISLGGKKSGKMFTHEDMDLIRTLSSQSAIALENARLFKENIEKERMEEELKIAHDIQVSMLPERAPEIEGFEIAGSSIPAREVGGDFYDYMEISGTGGGKRLGIVIGDVSGKGVSGALMMSASRSTYRVLAEKYSSVSEVMCVGNERLNKDLKKGMFVALLYAVIDPWDKTLTLSNAGQTQPVLCNSENPRPSYIDTEGDRFPLGIVKDCNYEETRIILKNGDIVVFYTDGIVEAMNDKRDMYGFDRLMTSIEEGRGLNADSLLEKLMKDVSDYVGDVEQHDDLTVVVVKCKH